MKKAQKDPINEMVSQGAYPHPAPYPWSSPHSPWKVERHFKLEMTKQRMGQGLGKLARDTARRSGKRKSYLRSRKANVTAPKLRIAPKRVPESTGGIKRTSKAWEGRWPIWRRGRNGANVTIDHGDNGMSELKIRAIIWMPNMYTALCSLESTNTAWSYCFT